MRLINLFNAIINSLENILVLVRLVRVLNGLDEAHALIEIYVHAHYTSMLSISPPTSKYVASVFFLFYHPLLQITINLLMHKFQKRCTTEIDLAFITPSLLANGHVHDIKLQNIECMSQLHKLTELCSNEPTPFICFSPLIKCCFLAFLDPPFCLMKPSQDNVLSELDTNF